MNTRAMDCSAEEMWENVRSHRVQIVRELRVDRSVLFDHLRSKAVFDNEDCQIVHAEKTNERKASKLLDILETKGKEGLEHFLDVLQRLNPGLYEKLTGQKATTSKDNFNYLCHMYVSGIITRSYKFYRRRVLNDTAETSACTILAYFG